MFSVAVVLAAGFVRGFSGFGFSMIMVVCLSMVFSPVEIVPVILLLEVAASLWMLPRVWRQVDWPSLKWLYLGIAAGTPTGVYLLATIPGRPMRAAIALVVMILVVLLWRGFRLKRMPGKPATVLTGLISGAINGSASIGGPPVILFFFSSPAGITVSRASLIAFFFGTDLLASGICAAHGLVKVDTLILAAIFLVPLILGLIAGSRSFIRTDPEAFRKKVMVLLLLMSVTMLTRTVVG
ncbi:MAG: sulfite exporter TauE/SafE family protein [Proteobacteria bacterium]|nr:sulfite exporter TauE/SafE family protein [Pseudomonadota bacterium]